MSSHTTSTKALLTALAGLYVATFTSLVLQSSRLFGSNGLLPLSSHLKIQAEQLVGSTDYSSAAWRLFCVDPSVLWFHAALGLTAEAAQQLVAFLGLVLSLAVLWRGGRGPLRPGTPGLAAAMGALWLLLLSARSAGQGFMGGVWDATLLEAGWAAIWLAAQPGEGSAPPALLLLRWQLFKASVMDGTAKLRVACPGVAGLAECFGRVASTVVSPGRSNWLGATMQPWLQASAAALLFSGQLPGAFLVLSPFRGVRLAGALLQLSGAALGAVSGAGGPSPAPVIAGLCISLLDDAVLAALCTRWMLALARVAGAKAPGGGPAAAAAAAVTPGRVAVTPIVTGKARHVRRDSLDELLASPRYHETAAEELLARAQSEAAAAQAERDALFAAPLAKLPPWAARLLDSPVGAAALKPYAWCHTHPGPAAGAALGVAAVMSALVLAADTSESRQASAEALMMMSLPLAALLWGAAIAVASALALHKPLSGAIALTSCIPGAPAKAAAAAPQQAAAAATPLPAKAAAAKKGVARQAADALLSPPTSPKARAGLPEVPETPLTLPAKGAAKRAGGAKAAAKAVLAGTAAGPAMADAAAADRPASPAATPGKGRVAKATAAAAAKVAAKEEDGGADKEKEHKGKAKPGAAAEDKAGEESKQANGVHKADVSKAGAKAAPGKAGEARAPEIPKAGADGSKKAAAQAAAARRAAQARSWLCAGASCAATLAVALTFLAGVVDTFWVVPPGQQGAARLVPGLPALHAAALTLGAATGPSPWQQQLAPAAAARAAGLPPGSSLLPVVFGSRDGGATWEHIVFADLARAALPGDNGGGSFRAGSPQLLPGGFGPWRPWLGEQLMQAGTGDLGEHLWLVRLADQLMMGSPEVAGLLHPDSPFRNDPPLAVKIDLYEVRPAPSGHASDGPGGAAGGDGWWSRRFVRELLPPIEHGNAAVGEALKEMHWDSAATATQESPSGLAAALAVLQRHPTATQWVVFIVAVAGLVFGHAEGR